MATLATDPAQSAIVDRLGVTLPPTAPGVAEDALVGEGYIGYYDGDSFDGQVDYNISLSKDAFTLMFSDSDMDGSDAQVAVTYTFDLDL